MEEKTIGETIVDRLRRFIDVQGALFAILLLGRVYEFVAMGMSHPLPDGVFGLFCSAAMFDLFYLCAYSLIILLPFVALSFLNERSAFAFVEILAFVVVIGTFLLDQYFFVTFVPLGADFFGYSWSDILLTVRSSGGYGLVSAIPLLVIVGAMILLLRFARKHPTGPSLALISTGIVILAGLATLIVRPGASLFNSDREFYLAANKMEYFIADSFSSILEKSETPAQTALTGYPLLHDDATPDVLGPYLNLGEEKPNLVFIIVEGLGRALAGENAPYGGFTPFVDSLTRAGLYWENFLSSSGRTFGVLPGLMGSLPYGENGFMEMSYKMPSHISLISVLNDAGYFTSYYYGGDISFDHQNVFLERQKIGRIIEARSFGASFVRSAPNEQGFSWGYDDGDLFQRSLQAIDSDPRPPRLDIYMTLTTHEPFLPPHRDLYEKEFEERLAALPWDATKKEAMEHYKQEFESLLYTDRMLREFFRMYSQRPEYKNTIFFITGDHRMIPIPSDVMLDRFHVPFIIVSPMVRRPLRFSSVSSHLDVAPTVIALLKNRYHIPSPGKVAWLGTGIDTAGSFRNIHSLPLMRNKNELVDYIDGEHYLSVDEAYKVRPDLNAELLDDSGVKDELLSKLTRFKEVNYYVCANDKIYPSQQRNEEVTAIVTEDSSFAALHLQALNSDQLFSRARASAVAKKFDEARIVCNHMLRDNPDYHDVRVLLGLTYAWEGKYWNAEPVYREVLRRAPHYPDAVVAYADIDIWQGHNEAALEFLSHEEPFNPKNKEILFRKAKALYFLGKIQESAAVFDTLRNIDPAYSEAKEFRAKFSFKH